MSKAYHRSLSQLIGPLATLATLVVLSLWPGLSSTVALAFVPLVYSAASGGLGPALVSAFFITAYAAFAYLPDFSRVGQVGLAAFVIAWMVGYLRQQAELSQSLDNNMARLREAVEMVRQLRTEWDDLSDSGKRKLVGEIESVVGNLATLVFGWHSISQEQEHIKQELGIKDDD